MAADVIDRSAFLQPLPEQQHRRAHLRQARADGRRVEDDSRARDVVESRSTTTWEFKLRKGVKFHDGSEFTAEDVVVLDRPRAEGRRTARGPFSAYTKAIIDEGDRRPVHDPLQVRAALPAGAERPVGDLHRVEEGRRRRVDRGFQFGQGGDRQRAVQVRQVTNGDRIELVRNDAYWGGRRRGTRSRSGSSRRTRARCRAARRRRPGDREPPTADLARMKRRQASFDRHRQDLGPPDVRPPRPLERQSPP